MDELHALNMARAKRHITEAEYQARFALLDARLSNTCRCAAYGCTHRADGLILDGRAYCAQHALELRHGRD